MLFTRVLPEKILECFLPDFYPEKLYIPQYFLIMTKKLINFLKKIWIITRILPDYCTIYSIVIPWIHSMEFQNCMPIQNEATEPVDFQRLRGL